MVVWLGRGGAQATQPLSDQSAQPVSGPSGSGGNLSAEVQHRILCLSPSPKAPSARTHGRDTHRDFEADLARAKEEEEQERRKAEEALAAAKQQEEAASAEVAKQEQAAEFSIKDLGKTTTTEADGSRKEPAVVTTEQEPAAEQQEPAAEQQELAAEQQEQKEQQQEQKEQQKPAAEKKQKKSMMVAAAWVVPGEKGEKGLGRPGTQVRAIQAQRGKDQLSRQLKARKARREAAAAAATAAAAAAVNADDMREAWRLGPMKSAPLSVRAVIYVVAVWMTMRIVARLTHRGVLGSMTFILIVSAAARVLARCLHLQGR
eukprot:scaffold31_cov263-Pinguiococcus_pyrenoidosus.AAC.57